MPVQVQRTAKQLASEREVEEAELRRQYNQEIGKAEVKARRDFEARIAGEREKAWATWKSEVTGKVSQEAFEAQLAEREKSQREQFEAQLKAEKAATEKRFHTRVEASRRKFQRRLGAGKQQLKREYSMQYGRQIHPKMVRSWMAGEREAFETMISVERETRGEEIAAWETRQKTEFEAGVEPWRIEELAAWEKAAVEWKAKEREKIEEELEDWEKAQRTEFEGQVQKWKSEQARSLETQLKPWREQWQPKGLAERLMEIKMPSGLIPSLLGYQTYELAPHIDILAPKGRFPAYMEKKVAPFAPIAGFVASFESFGYTLGTLAGLPTPRIPPTLTGGLIGKGISELGAATGFWDVPSSELERTMGYGAEYALGSIFGDIVLALGLGKVAEKTVIKPVSQAWRGSRLDRYLLQHSQWYYKKTGGIAPSIVSIGRTPEILGMESAKRLPAISAAWEMTVAPRTVGLMVTPAAATVKTATISKSLPHLIAHGGKVAKGFLVSDQLAFEGGRRARTLPHEVAQAIGGFEPKYRMPSDGLLHFVKGKLPLISDLLKDTKARMALPKLVETPKKAVELLPKLALVPELGVQAALPYTAELAGLGAILGVKAVPKAPARVQPATLEGLKPGVAEITTPIVEVAPAAREKVAPALKMILTQRLLEIPKAPPPQLKPPILQRPRRRKELKRRPRTVKPSGGPRARRGRYELQYPVRGVRSAAKYILGKA